MSATKLFISYSHDDEVWKEKLLDGLRVLERKNSVALWDANELRNLWATSHRRAPKAAICSK
jgi:hypothetical protein